MIRGLIVFQKAVVKKINLWQFEVSNSNYDNCVTGTRGQVLKY
jgi:hypothetical protein